MTDESLRFIANILAEQPDEQAIYGALLRVRETERERAARLVAATEGIVAGKKLLIAAIRSGVDPDGE